MSAYTDTWAKATPETPAGFLLRMAGYEITLLCREKVEQDKSYRDVVLKAAYYLLNNTSTNFRHDIGCLQAAYDELEKED